MIKMPSDKQKILILVITLFGHVISTEKTDDDPTIRASRSIEISTSKIGKLLSEDIMNLKNFERLTTKNYLNTFHTKNDESLVMESAGGGKSKQRENDNDDEDKKTLSQQVAEGKYGLIQKELFSKPAKSLGIISYVDNPEVPNDTIKNLGGLTPDDIWLAEDHLLILKGGVFPAHTTKTNVNWPPIDNYKAPRRQVKIPYNPKIPPPFPVQLQDNGPIQLIGPNGTTRIVSKGDNSIYPPEGYAPGTGPFFPSEKENNGDTPFPIPPYGIYPPSGNFSKGSGPLPFPYPPPPRGIRPLPPFIESLPPNAVYLPPPGNQTDMYDDEDPSIYYPPPYSFYYSTDNTSSKVEPGPLVPGIILPPPPDFFGLLDSNGTKKENKTSTTTASPVTEIYTSQIPPTTTPIPIVYEQETIKPILVQEKPSVPERIPINIPEEVSDTPENEIDHITTPIPVIYTVAPKKTLLTTVKSVESHRQKPYISIGVAIKKTKLYPQKSIVPTTTPLYNEYPESYYDDNTVISNKNHFKPVYGPPKKPIIYDNGRVYISSTPVPLKAFFTTSSEIESNSVTADPINYYQQRQATLAIRASPQLPNSKAEFYYYEEPKTSTDRKQIVNDYYNQQVPQYNIRPQQNGRAKAVYIAIPANQNLQNYPQSTLKPVDPISQQIVQLQQEIQSYLTSPRYKIKNKPSPTTSKPIYEYSFQAANYVNKNTDKNDNGPFRPIVQDNHNFYPTTPTPNYNYQAQNLKQQEYYYEQTPTRAPPTRLTTNQPRHTYRKTSYQNFNPTENPINYAYYTKQDERLLDDITKEYFTVFGQKLENGKSQQVLTTPIQNVISTTPLPKYQNELQNNKQYIETVAEPLPAPPPQLHPTNIEVKFGDNTQKSPDEIPKKISLHSDILVNYKDPRPPINPNSEWIPQYQSNVQPQLQQNIQQQRLPISLESDINVNNKYPRPPINPHAEYIIKVNPYVQSNHRNPNAEPLDEYDDYVTNSPEVINNNGYIQQQSQPLKSAINKNPYQSYQPPQQVQKTVVGEGQPGQIIAFRLPGNGAHFYFITPQVSSQVLTRQKQNLNNNAYVYEEPSQRLRRSRSRFRERQQIYNVRS